MKRYRPVLTASARSPKGRAKRELKAAYLRLRGTEPSSRQYVRFRKAAIRALRAQSRTDVLTTGGEAA